MPVHMRTVEEDIVCPAISGSALYSESRAKIDTRKAPAASASKGPTLKPIRPQLISRLEQLVATANPNPSQPHSQERADTLSPFALLIALRGLKTLRTLRIFTTEMALDLRRNKGKRASSVCCG